MRLHPLAATWPMTSEAHKRCALRRCCSAAHAWVHVPRRGARKMPRKLTNVVRPVPDDLVVAQACEPLPISAIAEELGLTRDDYDEHGKSKAKARAAHLRGAGGTAWRHALLTAARRCEPARGAGQAVAA